MFSGENLRVLHLVAAVFFYFIVNYVLTKDRDLHPIRHCHGPLLTKITHNKIV